MTYRAVPRLQDYQAMMNVKVSGCLHELKQTLELIGDGNESLYQRAVQFFTDQQDKGNLPFWMAWPDGAVHLKSIRIDPWVFAVGYRDAICPEYGLVGPQITASAEG